MTIASDDSRIHAEAITKAACINATAILIAAGKIEPTPSDDQFLNAKNVALYAMTMWAQLESPSKWPSKP
jgi:hypothetical protein